MAVSEHKNGEFAGAVWAGPMDAPRPVHRAARSLIWRLEAEQDRWFLWLPVALGIGAGAYFGLGFEPSLWLAAPLPLFAIAAVWRVGASRAVAFAITLLIAVTCLGFAAAKIRTEVVAAPKLDRRVGPVPVEGWIESIEPRASGRVSALVRVSRIEGLQPSATPFRVRLSMAESLAVKDAGIHVSLFAVLMPPPRPVAPGAYDFARRAWFERIGAYGYTLAAARPLEAIPAGNVIGWVDRMALWIDRTRYSVAERIGKTISGPGGAIASALLTGLRGSIPEDDLKAIRDAGLAHLLAISGLHMALMSGAAFWAVRFLIAGAPWLAVRIVSKKWAAGAGLAVAACYFLLAGGSVATERAFIMVAVALLAIVVDRPAISLRNVALSALIILLVKPETLLEAGFQMSFGAVVALTAFYEEAMRWNREESVGEENRTQSAGGLVMKTLVGVALTTLIASLATGPLAAYHFNRVAVYGLAANLVAVPLVGFIVMPLGLLALVLMPFGFDAPALALMGAGTSYLDEIARTVASWPGAVTLAPSPPSFVLPLFALGGLWLCIWRGAWRYWAVLFMAGAAAMSVTGSQAVLLVEEEGRRVAVRTSDGRLTLSPGRAARFEAEQWLRRDGDQRTVASATHGAGGSNREQVQATSEHTAITASESASGFSCDKLACVAKLSDGTTLAYVRHAAALAEECRRAEIILSDIPLRGRCLGPSAVIDRFDLYRHGVHAVYFDGSDIEVRRVSDATGDRPWARNVPWAATE